MQYNYLLNIKNDIKEWISDNHFDISNYNSVEETYEILREELWVEDSVTGNGGNYYDNEYNCEEYLTHNLEKAMIACEDFCIDMKTLLTHLHSNELAKFLDCLVRLNLLDEAILDVLNQF